MKIVSIAAVFFLIAGVQAAPPDTDGKRSPVLVELFTSEGCSSCPPADVLLESLDRTQPVAGAETIVLSEHVDYWNHIGWRDPFSSAQYSQRQQAYARRFRLDGAYTPQMVVNGTTEFVGNDGHRSLSEIAHAASASKATVRISSTGNPFRVRVDVSGAWNGDVFLVLGLNEAKSQVAFGEN